MKLGTSSYSLNAHQKDGTMTILDIIQWAKDNNCDHLELVPFDLQLLLDDGSINMPLVESIKEKADSVGMELSSFSLNACVLKETEAEYRAEIERIEKYMQICTMLGIKKMRHDTCTGQHPNGPQFNTPQQFEKDFPTLVKAIQELADYAASIGLNTTLENHGRYINGADRIIRLIEAANRPNLGMTMDVGNFICVDENNLVAVEKCVKYADCIHLKDFYLRPVERIVPGISIGHPNGYRRWAPTNSGRTLYRGSILGQGDLDSWEALRILKKAGYDSHISIEFEGAEECCEATRACLETARYIWDRV